MSHTRPKHIFIYALLSALTLTGVWSCRKDVEVFQPYPPTLDDLQELLQQVPSSSTQTTFILNAPTQDEMLVTPSGVRIFLIDPENLFANANADPVPCSTCQTLKIEITEALDKSDIIAYGVPTTTTDQKILESGGMVRVVATCDGKPLQLLAGRKLKIQIPAANPADNMFVFKGIMPNDIFSGWEDTGQQVFQAEWSDDTITTLTVQGYELLSKDLGWINADRFLNKPTSSFCVDLPTSFNPENTQAYIVFKNIRSVAFLEYDGASQKFCFPNAPIGFPVKLVTISKTADGQYWLGNYETEIGTDATKKIDPQKVSEQQMLDFLKSL